MKSTKLLSALLFFALLFTFSCQKDDAPSGNNNPQQNIPDSFSEYFGSEISRDFLGTVIDKNHNPIEGVTASIGHETAITDNNGVFIIRDATVNERFGYIKAEKAGYIHASRSVVPSDGTNKVKIMMLEKTVTSTISSGNPQTVTTDNGSSVSFDGNFIKEDGTAYSGSVDVIIHHLDPTDEDMTVQMPGMLYAQNEDGAERMLQTFGMLAVELRGSGGEDLNLAEGSTSEIKIPIDASLMINAPATIPLWYFDEIAGYWKEEGEATLQGNMYVGYVSHFSFWNYDYPVKPIALCVNVLDENGNEINNTPISITSETIGTTGGFTNEVGQVCGYVPSGESLELNLFITSNCINTTIHTETIGPFITDSNITVIIPEIPNIIRETIIGTLIDCSNDEIIDGYIQMNYGEATLYEATNTDGFFEITMLRCLEDNTFSIFGSDFNNLQTTGEINYTFTSPLTSLGEINACNTIDEFFTYSIDDGAVQKLYIDYEDLGTGNWSFKIQLHGGDWNNINTFDYIQINVPNQIGSYNVGDYIFDDHVVEIILEFEENGSNYYYHLDTIEESNITINVTKAAEFQGDYIDVNFNGEFSYLNNPTRTITGSVHMKKR